MKITAALLVATAIVCSAAGCATGGNQAGQQPNNRMGHPNNIGTRQMGDILPSSPPQYQHFREVDDLRGPVESGTDRPAWPEVRNGAPVVPDLADGKERYNREPSPLTLADLGKKYRSTFLLRGPSNKRQMALTFDDAPDNQFTPQILDVLKNYNVKATFFVVGNRAVAYPDMVKRMVAEGHVIGNHSYNHPNLPKLSDANFRDQILRTETTLKPLTGYTPKLVRPPYGNISEGQIRWLASQGNLIVNWNIDSLDWKGLDAEEVSTNILAHAAPGAIVLQHSGGGKGEDLTGTVQALPRIIERLQADGVQLVTLPELLDESKAKTVR